MAWINRIVMIPFVFALLTLILDFSYFFYIIYTAFAVGCFQVLSSLVTICYYKSIKSFKQVLLYVSLVIFYFISFFILSESLGLFTRITIFFIVYLLMPIVYLFSGPISLNQ